MKLNFDKQICDDMGIRLAYLFGSAARGDVYGKDIDIAVLLDSREPDPVAEMDIAERLKKLISESEPKNPALHVSALNSAGPLFRFEAIKEGVVLYSASEEERIGFEMKVLREYGDYRAKSRFYEDALRERLKGRSA